MRSLIVALIAAVVVASVAGQGTTTDRGAAESDRPLNLPMIGPDDPCPVTIGRRWDSKPDYIFGGPMWFGTAPVSVAFTWGQQGDRAGLSLSEIPVERGARRAKTPWIAEPSYSGPVDIRGRSLRTDRTALLFSRDMSSVPTERLSLRAPQAPQRGGYSFWPSSMFIPGPGCYGIQIDTTARTELVVFEAT